MTGKIKMYITAALLIILHTSSVTAEKSDKTAPESCKDKKLREQKEADIKGWALGCGAILTEYRYERHDMLLRNYLNQEDIKDIKETLDGWNANSRDSLFETLSWLEKGGHSKQFEKMGKEIADVNEQQYEELLEENKDNPDKLQKIKIVKKYYKQLGPKGLLGWDYSRYICLCRWGYIAGYISEEEAWSRILPAARLLQSKFDSWEDLGQNYLIGRQFWSFQETQESGQEIEDAFQRLLDEKSSPWNQYPWNMDLTLPQDSNEQNQPQNKQSSSLLEILKSKMSRTLIVPDNYKTITGAIEKAKSGDTVFVKAGRYKENIKFKEGIKLTGQDAKKVIIEGASTDRTITVSNCKSGSISNITIEHGPKEVNSPPKAGIVLLASDVNINRCRIRNTNGHCIRITEGSKPIVEDCNIAFSRFNGVHIDGRGTEAKIKNCVISDNTYSGIYTCQGANVDARNNVCRDNHFTGIYVQHNQSNAILENNWCTNNNGMGIFFYEGASGVAENNLCQGNKKDGIMVRGINTTATLKNNKCRYNQQYGIRFTEGASGEAKENLCEKNYRAGILVYLPGTKADILKNTCRLNKEQGIYFANNCSGIIENNICEKNGNSGIEITDTLEEVSIKGNWCRENRSPGIWLAKVLNVSIRHNICSRNNSHGIGLNNTKGLAEKNICEKNRMYGILIRGQNASPSLIENMCVENNNSGIIFKDKAQGKAENNTCENNKWSGIAVRGKGTNPALAGNKCNNNGAFGIISWAGANPNITDDNETIGNWRQGIIRRD